MDRCTLTLYRVFAPNWHRLGKRLLTMTTTGQNHAPNALSERRLITNGAGRSAGLVTSHENIIVDHLKCGDHRHHRIPITFDFGGLPRRYHHVVYFYFSSAVTKPLHRDPSTQSKAESEFWHQTHNLPGSIP